MNADVVLYMAVAIGLMILWYVRQASEGRRDDRLRFATEHGLHFSSNEPSVFSAVAFLLFEGISEPRCRDVIWGQWDGMSIQLAELEGGSPRNEAERLADSGQRHSVGVADLGWIVPPICIEPTSRLAIHSNGLIHRPRFESARFNRDYIVRTSDPEFAYKLIDARMMDYLESVSDFGFETRGRYLLVWSDSVKAKELERLLRALADFREHVPRLIWNEYGTGQEVGEERSAP